MIDVVAYCRYSSDNQREESINAQIRAIEDFCLKNNYNLIKIYKDEAISGTSVKDREQFLELIKASKNKNFKYVIVHKFDRFARNRYDHAIYEKKLNNNGVKLLSVLEQLNDSPEAVILKSVLTGMNEYYSLNLSREVKKELKENALKCFHNGGIPPLGYDVNENKMYVINEEEAKIIRLIFKMFINGVGYASIADELNKKGFRNKRGNSFKKNSIRDLLLNEKYIGTYVYGKKDEHGKLTGNEIRIENGIPRIIEEDIFIQAQNRFNNKFRRQKRQNNINNYLLSGFCICGECGGAYTGGYRSRQRNGKIDYGYLCINRKTKVNNCKCKPIEKNKLEKTVLNVLTNHLFKDKCLDEITNSIYNTIINRNNFSNKTLEKIDKEIISINNKLKKLLDKNLDGLIDDELFKAKNEELKKSLNELKIKRTSLTQPVQTDKEKIYNYLLSIKNNLDKIEIKQSLIKSFIHLIEVSTAGVNIIIKDIPLHMEKVGGDDGN